MNKMKIKVFAASLLALLSASAFASDVAMSISVGQPGFYGRLDIGGYPPPAVVYSQPVIVERPSYYVEPAPIYLRVPPGHMKHWSKHCREYGACGQRVLFVQDGWYSNQYVPRYREMHREREWREEGRREYRDEDRGHGHGRGHDDDDDDRGHGHGHGHH